MKLEILVGPEDGKIIDVNLDEDKKVTVGRLSNRDLRFTYGTAVTRRHGELFKSGDSVIFRDTGNGGKGSKHGTIIKRHGKNIEFKGGERELQPEDILIIGKCIWMRILG